MGIFGIFEDKKTKEELMAAKEIIAQLEKQLEEKTKENEELKNLINEYSNSEVGKTKVRIRPSAQARKPRASSTI